MSFLDASNTSKNSLNEIQSVTFPALLNSAVVHDKNASFKKSNIKFAGAENSNSKPDAKFVEHVSPGTEICVSAISENADFNNYFPVHPTDKPVMLDNDHGFTSFDPQSRKYSITDEVDRNISVKMRKNSKTQFSDSDASNYNLEIQGISPNNKSKTSSIFDQLLNKRLNSAVTRSSENPSNLSLNSWHNSPSHIAKKEIPSESNDGMQRAQMKTKLRSMWNNMKYGWRMKREVHLKTDSAIWLLGQCYHNKLNGTKKHPPSSGKKFFAGVFTLFILTKEASKTGCYIQPNVYAANGIALDQDVSEQFRQDLLSKIWLTYRINFPVIPGTNLVTDSGWGCMLRSGQMMMAQAFVCHYLQRDWRVSSYQTEAKSQLYKMILRWFGDSLSEKSPFSLHHLVSSGENYGRKAGDWYGPTHAAHVLRDALNKARKHHPLLEQLCMYVASDGIVFKQDVIDLCMDSAGKEENNTLSSFNSDFTNISMEVHGNSCNESLLYNPVKIGNIDSSIREETNEDPKSFENACPSYSEYGPPSYNTVKPKWKSLILFVSVRLGNDKINPFYIPCLKSLLAYEHCIGIIGGRPKHALYFIGWQDDKIIHMDPHSCQPAIDVEKDDFSEKTFHSSAVRTMSFSEMDPSCAIGFYFRELEEFQFFIEKFSEITAPLKRNLEYPVFALADGKRIEVEEDVGNPSEKCIYSCISNIPLLDDDDDDYILL